MLTTTNIQIGMIPGIGGSISVSYIPERDWIQVYAYDPDDLRKAGISVTLSYSDFRDLKTVLGRVDEAIEAEVKRRLQGQAKDSELIRNGESCVVITLSESNISLPEDLYRQAADLVARGNTMLAASLISKALTWISLSGAKEVAQAICEHQQSAGIRQ